MVSLIGRGFGRGIGRDCLAFIGLFIGVAGSAQAITLQSGADATAQIKAGAQYQSFNNSGAGRQRVGLTNGFNTNNSLIFSVSTASPANGAQWNLGGSSPITLSYDGNILSTTLGGTTTSRTVGSLGDVNYVQIKLHKPSTAVALALNNIQVNGSLPASSLSIPVSMSGPLVANAKKAGMGNGFILSADLVATGNFGGGASTNVQIILGHVAVLDSEGPETREVNVAPMPIIINGVGTVTATVDDTDRGGSDIKSAAYSLNGASFEAMQAQDGAFDGVIEPVTANFPATLLGTNQVCVNGTDVLNNLGTDTCQSFLVTYRFDGFFSPVDNSAVNLAKAGQSVPAKWRLTDANGTGIDNPASFVALYSYPVDCATMGGDVEDSVEQVAAGSSGLQYDGDGYWQFNWKTPKGFAGTCQAMYVGFDSGAHSPVATFKFK